MKSAFYSYLTGLTTILLSFVVQLFFFLPANADDLISVSNGPLVETAYKIELQKREDYAQKVLNKHIRKNNRAISKGNYEDNDYIVDLRRQYSNNTNYFLSEDKERELNQKIGAFHLKTGKAVYVLLGPVMPAAADAREGAGSNYHDKDQLTDDKIREFHRKYWKIRITKLKILEEESIGVLLDIESAMYLDRKENKWKIRFDDYVTFRRGIGFDVADLMISDIASEKIIQNIKFVNTHPQLGNTLSSYIDILHNVINRRILKIVAESGLQFTEDLLKNFTVEQRIQLLENISQGVMTDFLGLNRESIAINTLKTTPENQYKQLIDGIHPKLLKALVDKIDLGNFIDFINTLTAIFVEAYPKPQGSAERFTDTFVKRKFIFFGHWDGLEKRFSESGDRIIFKTRDNFKIKFKQEIEASPFEYLLIRFDDNFTIDGVRYEAGYIDYVPAIYCYLLFNESNNRKLKLAVDGILLVAGVGALAEVKTGIQLTKALLEIGVAVTDISLNHLLADKLNQSDEGRKVLQTWNAFVMVYAGATLSPIILKSGTKFYNSSNRYLVSSEKLTKTEKTELIAFIEKTRKVLKEGGHNLDDDLFSKLTQPSFENLLNKVKNLDPKDRERFLHEFKDADKNILNKIDQEFDDWKSGNKKENNIPEKPIINPLNDFDRIQKHNVDLIAKLKAENPGLENRKIADLAKKDLLVPDYPFGYTREQFFEAQQFIKDELFKIGIKDAEGFATGSRITGMTTNPTKAEFGKPVVDFNKKDLDITLITVIEIAPQKLKDLAYKFHLQFGHKLGVKHIKDLRQIDRKPVFGKIHLNLN